MARLTRSAIDKEITIPQSRNPAGVYSDAASGRQTQSYKIQPGKTQYAQSDFSRGVFQEHSQAKEPKEKKEDRLQQMDEDAFHKQRDQYIASRKVHFKAKL